MQLPPSLLSTWLSAHEFAVPPIRYNLAASTGPRWTFGELLQLDGGQLRRDMDLLGASYAPTEGSKRLREQIAKLHGVDPDWVVVTTGASEALSMLFCLASGPKTSVALPAPGYPATEVLASAWGLKVRHYALTAETQFKQDADTVLASVDSSTRLALVNTPHNPTGSVMRAEHIRALASRLAERSVPLIVDEVFHRLYFSNEQRSAALEPNCIVVGDMSKSLSLPGLRVGWLIDSDAKRRQRLIEARSYFTISGSPLLEAFAVVALENSATILERLKATTQANLAALEKFVDSSRLRLKWVKPQGGTLAFPWLQECSDTRPLCEAWARKGVLVAPGDCFGMPQHLRVGFGVATLEDFERALDCMERVLSAPA